MEAIKYLEATICLLLVTTVIHQTKLSTALAEAIKFFLGDYRKRSEKMTKALKDDDGV